jgi:hypothetical protein
MEDPLKAGVYWPNLRVEPSTPQKEIQKNPIGDY